MGSQDENKAVAHDLADNYENERERTGDEITAVQDFSDEQHGYHKTLRPRQLQMIAIGGAIGTGLFLGAGGGLHFAGPSLALVYVVCGFFAFLILRALGELVLYRPSSGSFVSYAREFYGEKMAFFAGWMYILNWTMTAIADVTAIAIYVQFWSLFTVVPQWVLALIALVIVLGLNLVSVKVFGEMEFWFTIIKISALVLFLIIGSVFLGLGFPTADGPTGFALWANSGGILPNGFFPVVIVTQGVIFAYAAIELVGTAAGETAEPEKIMPRAVNTVIFRVAIFYVGAVLILSLLLPYSSFSADQSPFVAFFSKIGSPETGQIAATVMNFVVLTAAFSSLNAGLYSTGRIFHSMAIKGGAPQFTKVMNKNGVPFGGILLTAGVTLLGVGLNAILPHEAFEIVINMSALGIIFTWGIIVLCQIKLQKWVKQGKAQRSSFRLFGAPFTAYLTLGFLALIVVLMAIDWPIGTLTVASLCVIIPGLIIGWFYARRGIRS